MKCSYCWEEILSWIEDCPYCKGGNNWKLSLSWSDTPEKTSLGKGKRIWRLRFFLTILLFPLLFILIIFLFSGNNLTREGVDIFSKTLISLTLLVIIINAVKRFHDLNMSWWNVWWVYLPLVNFYFLFILLFVKWTNWDNQYWNDPLEEEYKGNVNLIKVILLFIILIWIVVIYHQYTENDGQITTTLTNQMDTTLVSNDATKDLSYSEMQKATPRLVRRTINSIELEWDKIPGAVAYVVKYSNTSVANSSDQYAQYWNETIRTTDNNIKITELSSNHKQLIPDVSYYFTVVAVDKHGNESDFFSDELMVPGKIE